MNTEKKNQAAEAAVQEKKPRSRQGRIIRIVLLIVVLAVCAELVRSNSYISVEEFEYASGELPKEFDGVKIVQISDYHNHGGSYDDRLIAKIEEQDPDYIFITGDTADALRTDLGNAESFLSRVSEVAPCWLVWGNHDQAIGSGSREELKSCCEENGITVLENECTYLERNGSHILLVGTDHAMEASLMQTMLEDHPQSREFTLWLHHYPEDFKDIADSSREAGAQADLLFTGHAHGGLVRLPFVGGLYAPGQGVLPEYTSGMYEYGGTTMIVSRGLGNSGYTKRFADPFHLVVCTLKCE